MNQSSSAVQYRGLQMAMSPAEAKQRLTELQAFVQAAMVAGTDYGLVPGTNKPSLFQPGAQKLCELYGFAWEFSDLETVQDWNKGFFFYRRRCVITLRRDVSQYVGDGRGSCNSREDRYAWRWLFDNELPKDIDASTLKRKTGSSAKGRSWTKYRLPNEDVYSLVNTIEKMACKRALVHAVIGATRSAAIFTQDREDLPPDVFGAVDEQPTWVQPNESPSSPAAAQGKPPAGAAPEGAHAAAWTPTPAVAGIYADIDAATNVKAFEAAQKRIVIAHKTKQISSDEYRTAVSYWNAKRAKFEANAPPASATNVTNGGAP